MRQNEQNAPDEILFCLFCIFCLNQRGPMARFVLATFGSLGDLHPVFALAGELRRRGHTVTIATSELYREKIQALGFPFEGLHPELSVLAPDLVRRIMDGARGSEYLVRDLMVPAVREMFADLTRATANA